MSNLIGWFVAIVFVFGPSVVLLAVVWWICRVPASIRSAGKRRHRRR